MQNRQNTTQQNIGQLVITYPTNIIATRFVTVMSSQFNGHLIGQCKFVEDPKKITSRWSRIKIASDYNSNEYLFNNTGNLHENIN